jgi:hypothetical protein
MKLDPDKDYQQPHICHILIFILSRNVFCQKKERKKEMQLLTNHCDPYICNLFMQFSVDLFM